VQLLFRLPEKKTKTWMDGLGYAKNDMFRPSAGTPWQKQIST
jgi:hypothetical protein